MTQLNRKAALLAAAVSAALCLAAPAHAGPGADRALREIAAVEKAFSARSAEVGAAQAWKEYFDPEEGLLFGPSGEPAKGAEAIYAAMGGDAPAPGVITWTSDKAWAAESGDLAASWGHWRFTPKDASKPARTGRYVTVWRKDATGHWKALMDIGNADEPAA